MFQGRGQQLNDVGCCAVDYGYGMAGEGGNVEVEFGEQRRGENLGTRAGLGEQGGNWCWYVLLVHGYDRPDSSLGGKMEGYGNGRGDR